MLDLHPQPLVALAIKPSKAAAKDRFAGLAALDLDRPGRIELLLSERAYVDLVKDGRALRSAAHRHAGCDGIVKAVSFDVQPGRYTIQMTDSPATTLRIAAAYR